MSFLSWIIIGLIAGGLSKLIMPGEDPGNTNDLSGIVITILIGIAGAIVGGMIGRFIGFGGVEGVGLRSIAIAIAGSLLLLYGYRKINEGKA